MVEHSIKVGKVSALRREMQRKIREVGIWSTLKLGVRKLIRDMRESASFKKKELHPFDLKYGTDTSGIIGPGVIKYHPYGKMWQIIKYRMKILFFICLILLMNK